MSNQILIKRSAEAAKVPQPADLVLGELALNTTDGKLFTKTGAGTVIELGASNVSAESSARAAADSTLQANIDAEATARAAADTTLTTAIATETTNRTTALALKYDASNPSAYQTLTEVNAAIEAVVAAAPAALNTLTELAAALGNDADYAATMTSALALKAATTYVDSQDASEASVRSTADITLQTNITNEATARTTADSTLTTNLATEVTNRAAADTTLQANIDAEATTRAAADTGLQSAVDTINGYTSGVTGGTYNNSATAITPYTVDAKGRITGTGAAVTITPAWGSITGTPTTLAGYGITDAMASGMTLDGGTY